MAISKHSHRPSGWCRRRTHPDQWDWADTARRHKITSGRMTVSQAVPLLDAIKDLTERVEAVEERVEKQIDQRSQASMFTQLSSLGIPGYTVQKPIPVTICQDGDEFMATFFDANISTGGDTEHEAVANLQTLIADFYDELVATPDRQLGLSLQRQKLVLGEFVCRI